MKALVAALIGTAVIFGASAADAKGCIKGALVGGTAGHFAGNHGFLGAAAGCVIGRHEANKHARQQQQTTGQAPNR
jgi:outer membrane lipoprotein SlyB